VRAPRRQCANADDTAAFAILAVLEEEPARRDRAPAGLGEPDLLELEAMLREVAGEGLFGG
jgi:hypothetical protein